MSIASDIEFLKTLQHELKEQDNDCQASPRFWVVAEKKREYGIATGYYDGVVVCDCDGNEQGTVKEFVAFLVENDYLTNSDVEKINKNSDFEDVLELLKDDSDWTVVGYKDNDNSIVQNTMFLTKKECKRHIELNGYHYKNPHSYAMTAWRSPEVEKLYKIIENFDWNYFQVVSTENDRLKSELSAMRDANRWIPVTERLPDEGIEVLGMDENGRRVVCEYSTRCFGWISEVDAMGDIVCWCPLAASPEGVDTVGK